MCRSFFAILLTIPVLLSQAHAAKFSNEKSQTNTEVALEKESQSVSNTFGVNADPLWLALGGLGAKFEYFINEKISLGIGGFFIPSRWNESSSSSSSSSATKSYDYKWEHNEFYLISNIMLTGDLNSHGLYISPAYGRQHTAITEFGKEKLNGKLDSPIARLTLGYQWILANHLRLAAGGGLNFMSSDAIVVKDASGKELLRDKSRGASGLALDLQVGFIF